jgi:hypothetical protein
LFPDGPIKTLRDYNGKFLFPEAIIGENIAAF